MKITKFDLFKHCFSHLRKEGYCFVLSALMSISIFVKQWYIIVGNSRYEIPLF